MSGHPRAIQTPPDRRRRSVARAVPARQGRLRRRRRPGRWPSWSSGCGRLRRHGRPAPPRCSAWVTDYFGWLFVLVSAAFLIFSGLPRGDPLRQHQARARRLRAGVLHVLLGLDDVRHRHGDRPDVLGRRRAVHLPHRHRPPASRPAGRRPARRRRPELAMEYAFFHWGFHPWAMYAVIGLAIGYFAYRKGAGNLVSAAFRPLLGDRASERARARRSTWSRSSRRCSAPRRPWASARCRSPAASTTCSAAGGLPVAHRRRHRGPHRCASCVSAVTGIERGVQVPVQRQRHRRRAAGVLPVRGRSDRVHHGHVHRVARRLPHAPADDGVPHRSLRGERLAQQLDDLLLGLVDLVDARSSACSSRGSPRAARSGSS